MTAAIKALNRPALVLNRNWQPISLTPTKKAIGLVAKGSAKIIDTEDFQTHDLLAWNDVSRAKAELGEDVVIRSASLAIVPPEVVVLTTYEGMAAKGLVFSRKNIFKRDKFTCMYCGVQPGTEGLTIDHILPRSRGGISSWTNCVLACIECNSTKANRTPEEAGMRLRKVPRKPNWKVFVQIDPKHRRESWDQFLSRAYWEVELEP